MDHISNKAKAIYLASISTPSGRPALDWETLQPETQAIYRRLAMASVYGYTNGGQSVTIANHEIVDMLHHISRKLRTYASIYTGDKEARSMADWCETNAEYLAALTEHMASMAASEEDEIPSDDLATPFPPTPGMLVDNPELDATDGAHPAWWRGHDHGADAICREATKILDGEDSGAGKAREPWETLRRRLLWLRADAMQTLRALQFRARDWSHQCFGRERAIDKQERVFRFLEEALELAQACGCSKSHAMQLADYVYARPAGDLLNEFGGTMLTMLVLGEAHSIDVSVATEAELKANWANMQKIREKADGKPLQSPLPQ